MHTDLFPTRSIPGRMHHRLVYLMLKRAERIDTHVPQEKRQSHRDHQVAQLVHLARDSDALDGELLGRLLFRLARLEAVRDLGPLLRRYMACKDKSNDPVAAGQPLAAVISEALEWHQRVQTSEALLLAWEALRAAFAEQLPIKHVLVQRLLGCSDPVCIQLCIPNASSLRSLDTSDTLASYILETCRLRPSYMHERAAVVLCKKNDPRAALELLDTPQTEHPFDLYAASITSLTWMARAHLSPAIMLFLAWRVLEAMQCAGMEADEQMYGEWIRALQALYNERTVPPPLVVSEPVLQTLRDRAPTTVPPWTSYVVSLARHILARHDEQVLRWDHLVLLFRMLAHQRHFSLCQSLYDYARKHYTDGLPFRSESTFAWLLSQACLHHEHMEWAVRLYYDWLAAGRSLPESVLVPFLRACLSRGIPSMVHVVVRDACEMETVPRAVVASHATRALFCEGHLEAGLTLLADLLTEAPSGMPRDGALPPALPPLAMYATGLYEASCVGRYGLRRDDRRRLFALLDEFRLVLAHTCAKEHVSMHVMDRAYYGAVRLHWQALGQEAGSAEPSDLTSAEDKEACMASLRDTWDEWHDMTGPQCGATLTTAERSSLPSIEAYIPMCRAHQP